MAKDNGNDASFILGLALGAAIGAGVAIVLAPQRGGIPATSWYTVALN